MTKKKRKHSGRIICMDCRKDMGPSNTPTNTESVCPPCKNIRLDELARTGPILQRHLRR